VWRDTQLAASFKRVIGHWLGVLAEIEAYISIDSLAFAVFRRGATAIPSNPT